MKTLGIFISTPGRKHLWRTLESIANQCTHVEDVLVVGDGYHDLTEEVCIAAGVILGLPVRYIATRKTRDWGHSQQNYGLQHVKGDYIIYQDDDDIFVPRALSVAGELINSEPDPVAFIGRVKTPRYGLLWQTPSEKDAVLDGHCLLVPNDKRRLGWFTSDYNGDQGFIHTTLRNFRTWKWVDRVWTLTRPHWSLCVASTIDTPSRWTAVIRRDDVGGEQVAKLIMDKSGDTYTAEVQEYSPLTENEWADLAEILMYAAQGGDLSVRLTSPQSVQAFLSKNYKEHWVLPTYTEVTHSWPPDFWEAVPQFNMLADEAGQRILDWRDAVWGGGKIIE